ncbi:MAG: response regulator transcription factor [Nitrospirota bacterium]
MKIRVLVVDDHRIFREGLVALLKTKPGIDIVGESEGGRQAIKMVHELLPDVVIMDIAMPDMNGIETTEKILKTDPGVKIIGLTMHSDIRYVTGMLRAGASGFLLKDCSSDELVEAIRAVKEGKKYLSRWVSENLVRDYVDSLTGHKPLALSALSAREKEVLQFIAEGKTTKQIAARLGVSLKTVETHRMKIMEKLGVKSIAELVKYAIREGLTPL